MEHMKWWGWGDEKISFTHKDKPGLAPFIRKWIDFDVDAKPTPKPDLDAFTIPPSMASPALVGALEAAVGQSHVNADTLDRVVHAYGKSMRDLLRVRKGDFGRLPDLIVYPESEDQVETVMKAALAANAVVIPFGGGTNIVGSLEAPRNEPRTVISVDMGRMNQLLDVDAESRVARVQAGALGPDLEAQLNARGWTLGHFPDSFNHSTLGGWIATRSSGMQSDKYGDIADLTRGLRVVTPKGTLVIRPVPSTSTGPSVREMVLGSEGRLGIITEATIHVHRIPEKREILAYLFPSWPKGLNAMRDIAASDVFPIVTRVSDAKETSFSFATAKHSGLVDRLKSKALKVFLRRVKHFDLEEMCLSFIGYEGSPAFVKEQQSQVADIVKKYGAICVGTGPGKLYDQKKFDTPYIRDFLLERGGIADVSETSAAWSQLETLHRKTVERAHEAFDEIGVKGWVMCHLSHSYHSGACLYFTFAFKQGDEHLAVKQYDGVKAAIQQSFIDLGATLSHHHAVGVEHKQWLGEDISEPGVEMIKALFDGVDPAHNLNPEKIV